MKAFRSLLGLFVRKNMVIREFAAWLCAAVLLPIIAPVFINHKIKELYRL